MKIKIETGSQEKEVVNLRTILEKLRNIVDDNYFFSMNEAEDTILFRACSNMYVHCKLLAIITLYIYHKKIGTVGFGATHDSRTNGGGAIYLLRDLAVFSKFLDSIGKINTVKIEID